MNKSVRGGFGSKSLPCSYGGFGTIFQNLTSNDQQSVLSIDAYDGIAFSETIPTPTYIDLSSRDDIRFYVLVSTTVVVKPSLNDSKTAHIDLYRLHSDQQLKTCVLSESKRYRLSFK